MSLGSAVETGGVTITIIIISISRVSGCGLGQVGQLL